MTNRILRSMLVFALLANQAAICGAHSHQDSVPSNHSSRAHVHVSGHSHYHHDSSEHQHPEDSESGFESSFPVDHDSDALYFGDQDNFQNQSNRLIVKDMTCDVIPFVAKQPLATKRTHQSQRTRAGPFSSHHCAIYLQTSRLLI